MTTMAMRDAAAHELGREARDNGMSRDEMLAHIEEIAAIDELEVTGWAQAAAIRGHVGSADIEALRDEAGRAGDAKMVRICDAALAGGEETSEWRECARVIADAAAQG